MLELEGYQIRFVHDEHVTHLIIALRRCNDSRTQTRCNGYADAADHAADHDVPQHTLLAVSI